MRISHASWLLVLPLLGGCQYLPHSTFFKAPENEPNPAWVRIVNFTQHAAIYQVENGVKTGGAVRRGELPFVHTQDMNMPKAGQDLTFDFYETPVRPDLKSEVYMEWEGNRTEYCYNIAQFTPKPGHYYEFWMTSGHSGKCKMHSSLIERDAQGEGWHLTPNPDVTYSTGSDVNDVTYGNGLLRDSD
ncbi:MAG TPA: hypothetical protein VJS90_00630 [Pseudomonas sp.]|uniref:hypothetical protein n=1 Tax=Pseudomonas sp. TaxID=306 RepID=UPI002B498EA3|nr:hypothetical protein [Pseudomonas sp.]HKS11519.1 hypothetical protein [Pseudomonas sp.]